MHAKRCFSSKRQRFLLVHIALLTIALSSLLAAQAYKVIKEYQAVNTGPLIADASGNLYGMDEGGYISRHCGCGTVFRLSPTPVGGWTKTVLYTFTGNDDGRTPDGRLTFDALGNLYGVTTSGGDHHHGVVFELRPSASGPWIESVVYAFEGDKYTGGPIYGVTLDRAGNIYGTITGSAITSGKIFELSPSPTGVWKETVLYEFSPPYGHDGAYPSSTLVIDSAGNLYGTTTDGGAVDGECPLYARIVGCGVVFELSHPSGVEQWTFSVIHTFKGYDGASPQGLVMDALGNLYGSAQGGRVSECACGVIYELSPNGKGQWTESLLHVFQEAKGSNGLNSRSGTVPNPVTFDREGNLWGTATYGGGIAGDGDGDGVVFKLTLGPAGSWKEIPVHTFIGGVEGYNPMFGVTFDSSGNIFGTTRFGGDLSKCDTILSGCGVVWQLKFLAKPEGTH